MASPTDALRTKTDAELLFFLENPGYYQPELVQAAGRELRRRGVAPAATTAASHATTATYAASAPPPGAYEEAPARRVPWLLLASVAVVLAVVALGFLKLKKPATPPVAATATAQSGHLSPDSLKLETAESHALPTFDIQKLVDEQLATIPQAEQQEAQPLRQFRELSRRFWAAETQTEYLTQQAHAGKVGEVFVSQVAVARDTWRDWNKAVVYSYRFGPQTQAQYKHMAQVAISQQYVLDKLPVLVAGGALTPDKETQQREVDAQAGMAGVRKTSPVTGRRYVVPTIQYRP